MSQGLLFETLEQISELNGAIMESVRVRQRKLAKPEDSLGRLEILSAQLAGITGTLRPALSPRTVIVCASDHGVTTEGVSVYPQEVTRQMVHNFLAGGGAINVVARQFGLKMIIVDVGVAAELPMHMQLRSLKVRPGTQNFLHEPAMSRSEAIAAIEAGIHVAKAEIESGARLLVAGEIGIGGTTPSAAIASVLTGLSAQEVTGPGTGLGLMGWRRKCQVIEEAIDLHQPDPHDAIDILSKVGGLEIGAIAGVVLAAAAAHIPVVIDSIVSTAGAAIACVMAPQAKHVMFAGHTCTTEPGHRALLSFLELTPILDLGIRIGEGVGAVLALPILETAVSTLNEMATYKEAGISYRLDANEESMGY